MENIRWTGVIGGALMVLGSFLPWVQSGIFSVAGTDGDGVFTLIAGLIALAIIFSKRVGRVPGVAVILLGVLGGLVILAVALNLAPLEDLVQLEVPDAGSGLYVVGLGSILTFATGFSIVAAK